MIIKKPFYETWRTRQNTCKVNTKLPPCFCWCCHREGMCTKTAYLELGESWLTLNMGTMKKNGTIFHFFFICFNTGPVCHILHETGNDRWSKPVNILRQTAPSWCGLSDILSASKWKRPIARRTSSPLLPFIPFLSPSPTTSFWPA